MTTQATHAGNDNGATAILYMALELSWKLWKVMLWSGGRQRIVDIPARDVPALLAAIARAKVDLARSTTTARVVSCYEAGRDGFWLDRALRENGVENLVVDSSAIEVSRRAKKAKSDRIDVGKLMALLRRHVAGEADVFRIVRVPSAAAEDDRRSSRELERLKKELSQHLSRIRSLLALHGISCERIKGRVFAKTVADLRDWKDRPLPDTINAELGREAGRLALVEEQIKGLGDARRARLRAAQAARRGTVQSESEPRAVDAAAAVASDLTRLKALGPESSWVFAHEFFAWREFANGRQVGAAAGLCGTPFASGASQREQGLDKSGNRRIRTMAVEIAWLWLRYQPDSALSQWYRARFASGGVRARKVGIVALARKLMIALWRFVTKGIVPEGAVLKAA
jgi:transposase